jgi:hypothetical protein
MKRLLFVLAFIISGFVLTGCLGSSAKALTEDCKPDLVVTSFEITGAPIIDSENRIVLPVRVIVKNQGDADADVFKVSTSYMGSRETHVVAFTVPKRSHPWYPYTWDSLEAGAELSLDGTVTFDPSLHDTTVALFAYADSCSGEEFMPSYCRIDESNEGNNQSKSVSVDLPQR